ncbi:MAG: nucleotidyltransferase domain-containing protein [Chloroflexota bacterium]
MAMEAPVSTTVSAVAETDLLAHDPVLTEIVRRLVAAFQPERIHLFGSSARGDTGPDSDYDLTVVVSVSNLAPHRRDILAFRALCGVRAAKDVVVYTREEFASRGRAASSLPAVVLHEGRLLYAA